MPKPAAPPSPQEIHRKLSIHSTPTQPRKQLGPRVASTQQAVSGTESDSDSILSPDNPSLTPSTSTSAGALFASNVSQPPLSSIAEGSLASEDSEDDREGDEDVGVRKRRSNDETIIRSGYLWKKGERRKAWKKRWFVLRSVHLVYYKTSAEYRLLQLLDLGDIHTCTPVTLKRHENTFCIVSPNRTYYLQAGSSKEVQEWVKAVNEARDDLQLTSTVTEGMVVASSTAPIPVPRRPGEASRSPSHSPYGLGITSSDSEAEGSTPGPRSFGISPDRLAVKAPGIGKDGSKPVLSGYLMKCGSRRSASWHHRWFVLAEDKLTYSRSHMDSKPHREIPLKMILDALDYEVPHGVLGLKDIREQPQPPNPSSQGGTGVDSKHTFKIVTTKRTLVLCAPSEEESIKWLSAVRALIARRSEAGVVPGNTTELPSSVGRRRMSVVDD
ncbi:PH-domain-containing protein [Thelephora terrestris]|uniref:PH-domain-containing protein n=1 Tax=Thelephora terrestris TaxID=56493 RepID=A0A9P6H4K2_9AGAM|nr:PH-domain-containing protein [Thelephora terrestris]